ncbi:MAG: tetratricopeptide repeat protein [Verrucomicrobia bacterium]|nr:tetratricopeptide repeat protein [Verrucomicrobiota bacterium]
MRSLSSGQRWGFRLLAMALVPCFLLGLVELILRLAGYGYETSFFLERRQNGERVLIENARFGWRFFPTGMARSPSPQVIRAVKPPGAYRIFVFGESAALGDPKPAYGVGRYLEALLRERFPGREIEVICVAMTAINSHAILPIARECARYGGDAWILYMGNNEMEGPFGASPVLGGTTSSLGIIRATLALRTTRLGQLIQATGDRLKRRAGPASWEGMKMFQEHQLPPDDPLRSAVHSHFQKNLEDIVRAGVSAGVKPLVCTVASNLRDCAPFASAHRRGLSEAELTNWKALYGRGTQLEMANQFSAALELFEQAARSDGEFAELPFRAGRCAEQLTNFVQARGFYERARDVDSLPFRTDAALNAIVRDVAGRFARQGAQLVDAEAELARESPQAIFGREFFYDHVHLTFEGNYQLARLLAQRLENALPPAMIERRQGEWATAEVCERRLGLSDWNRNAAYEAMLQRLADAPFTNQLNSLARLQALAEKISQTRARMHPREFLETRAMYEEAVAKSARDPRPAENFAEFLESSGDMDAAIAQWRRVAALVSHHHVAFFQLGRLLAQQGKLPEAAENLLHALALRPDLAEGRLELGQVRLREAQPESALTEFLAARQLRPEDPRAHLQLAAAYAALKRRPEAMASLREAVRLRPRYWEARYLLGVELANANQLAEAQTEFAEVIRIRPNHPSGSISKLSNQAASPRNEAWSVQRSIASTVPSSLTSIVRAAGGIADIVLCPSGQRTSICVGGVGVAMICTALSCDQ